MFLLTKFLLLIPQAELLTGIEVCDMAHAQKAADVLRSKGCERVIITLGDKGSVLTTAEHAGLHIPAPPVKAVDTTVSTAVYYLCVCACACACLHACMRACCLNYMEIQLCKMTFIGKTDTVI